MFGGGSCLFVCFLNDTTEIFANRFELEVYSFRHKSFKFYTSLGKNNAKGLQWHLFSSLQANVAGWPWCWWSSEHPVILLRALPLLAVPLQVHKHVDLPIHTSSIWYTHSIVSVRSSESKLHLSPGLGLCGCNNSFIGSEHLSACQACGWSYLSSPLGNDKLLLYRRYW